MTARDMAWRDRISIDTVKVGIKLSSGKAFMSARTAASTILAVLAAATPGQAREVAHYVCAIGGVYENIQGKLVQRADDKALGKLIYIDMDTGEVTGHFGTDGFDVQKIRRPNDDALLTIETASGLEGDAANRLTVVPPDETNKKATFVYTKSWLIISGECSAVLRRG